MIKYVKGDLFDASEDIIAHGVNCQGGFGSGVAGIMADRHPTVKVHYIYHHKRKGWELGEVQFVVLDNNKIVANCATQDQYYPRNKCHADYPAIKKSMTVVKNFAQSQGYSVAIPKIGAGLAGGDWTIIEGILNEVFSDYDVTVYVL